MRRQCLVGGCLLLALTATQVSQSQERPPEICDIGPAILRAISPLLLPKVLGDVALLRNYIRSEEFARLRIERGDCRAVDAIYDEALRVSWNNVYEALLISSAATLDHRRVGVRLPVVGPLLWLPLTSEFADDFTERVAALPSNLYPDTPPEGDRDKLQHFFGSAFMAYTTEANDPAGRVGDFVEYGEELFIVGGVNDARDKRSNTHGRKFGLTLLVDESVEPSEFMVLAREGQ